MKELSIEEKARRYDEAIEKGKQILNTSYTAHWDTMKEVVEHLLPELAESEDEKIRKAIGYAIGQSTHSDGTLINGVSSEEALAWLEKQGEQKPTDKVEPKFKVGDWVVVNGVTQQVTQIRPEGFDTDRAWNGKLTFKDVHLWTIQDAKDGDVLVASDGSIFLFKDTIDGACKHYVALTTDDVVKFNEGLKHYWETSSAVHPATKEQRDLLFQKIKEKGYEWDAEKRELRKIENEIEIPFGAKDSELQETSYHIPEGFHAKIDGNRVVIKRGEQNPTNKVEPKFKQGDIIKEKETGNLFYVNSVENFGYTLHYKDCIEKGCVMSFKYEDNYELVEHTPAWSEEDEEHLNSIIESYKDLLRDYKACHDVDYIPYNSDTVIRNVVDDVNFLKSLKNRVQPQSKHEWSEEDRIHYNKCLQYLESISPRKEDIEWFKSLRPQSQWKPSEGQLECLDYAIEKAEKDWSPLTNNRIYLTLKALEEQLLELKGSKV